MVMKRPKDIFAKCITWQDFAAYLQSIRCGDAAKGKCNRCDCILHLLAHDGIDEMVATALENLLDLPPELLLMIVDATEKPSLANMRLTCRKLQDLTNEAFGVVFFRTRHVIASESSVETLLEIARHAVFGRYVKEITLSSDLFQGPLGDIDPRVDLIHTFSSTMPRVFKNIQNNYGSVDLTSYESSRFINGAVGDDLAEVFYMVTRMVKQSQCALGRVWIAGKDWREECSDVTLRMFMEADGWKRPYRIFR